MIGAADRAHRHDDRGAALLLAIGFVVMIGAISAGLAAMVTSGVTNQTTLVAVRDRQYAADGAVETAIAEVRHDITVNGSDCSSAAGVTRVHLDDVDVRVDWRNDCGVVRTADGFVVARRDVAFDACIDAGASCSSADTIINAVVAFDQDSSGTVTHTAVQSWSVLR
ncbi:MAG: hypothetical protein JWM34_916 [Ilumatobacteraceae bacterium]|nr:hypothetical protein [Ilumatobacteraceae bacterium]